MPANTIAKPPTAFGYSQFILWAPDRQRKWLSAMQKEKASNKLSAQKIQTLKSCEQAFAQGL